MKAKSPATGRMLATCLVQTFMAVSGKTILHLRVKKCCRQLLTNYFLKNIKCFLLMLCLGCLTVLAGAQGKILGAITDNHGKPVPAATILIKKSPFACVSDSAGHFSLVVNLRGEQIIAVSCIGYMSAAKKLEIIKTDSVIEVNFVLQPSMKNLDPVIVAAGSFEASDKAKGASLTPMDAMTVAGNGGDIANSLRSLPGAQQVGEKEGLFVRGGTSEESKQFVDGLLMKNPNYGSVPGIMQPARVNPFLFKGILFNTGGYSSLYGEALSSALILETMDFPDKSSASLHIFPMSLGTGFQKLAGNKKNSYGLNLNYGSYALYDQVIKQHSDFFHSPEYIEADANFRIRTGKTGILKFYANLGYNHTGMQNPDIDSNNLLSTFETEGKNLYSNISYRQGLANNWKIDAGLGYNHSTENITTHLEDSNHNILYVPYFPFNKKNLDMHTLSDFAQLRLVCSKSFKQNQSLSFGIDQFLNYNNYRSGDTVSVNEDRLTAGFIEGNVYITHNIAAKIGVRFEHSSWLSQSNIASRISLAYRFSKGGQINFAYGKFYQEPDIAGANQDHNLDFTEATHFILNYQQKRHNRLLRIEAYYKLYHQLITTVPMLGNYGYGRAKGLELFFRDKRTFKNFDYWIAYTFLDTKRKFLNYPYELQPDFTTPHTVSLAAKRFFPDISLSANLSYFLATGRPYYHIGEDNNGKPVILDEGTTSFYNQLNLSFAYLFTMFKKWTNKDFSGIGFGINNVFGTKQVFGYNYSYNGLNKIPITLPATRSYYIGLFMTFGIDRRNDFIDDRL